MRKVIDLLNEGKVSIDPKTFTFRGKIKQHIVCNGSNEFYTKFFNMQKWWFAASDVGEKEGPYIFIGEPEGIPSLIMFTESIKAAHFARENKIRTNENGEYVIARTPLSIITSIGDYEAVGIKRIIIDLCWQIQLEQFKKLYFTYVNNYNFSELVNKASVTGNTLAIGELWTAIFNLQAWYFIGNLEQGNVYGTKMKEDRVIFVYLTYSEALKTVKQINEKDKKLNYKIYRYTPSEGYEFLLFMKKEAALDGIILRDKDVYNGARIETITKVREVFEI